MALDRFVDPSPAGVKVTRQVTEHLAGIAGRLEREGHAPEVIAGFLMRCALTMFVEGVGLLPGRPFTTAVEDLWRAHPESFPLGLETLWRAMRAGPLLGRDGGLLQDPSALRLGSAGLRELLEAARCDWSDVEPTIFGTLLERALSANERHRLGAHFTPRAYVERLVRPTIEEPLRAEWEQAQARARKLHADGELSAAREALHAFHEELCRTRVLDPACGTGNFLYVALGVLEQIEGEVLSALADLGEHDEPLQRVTPGQLLGIEVKPWAKRIAELVLWIGHAQRRCRMNGKATPEPVLQDFANIEQRDALLAWDDAEPRRAPWPKAAFIVGNPPYLGARHIRSSLGDRYVEALRAVYPEVPETADLVMYWWHRAAEAVESEGTRRFGMITTNSIFQAYSRRVLDDHLSRPKGIVIAFAIPDHPWVQASDGAAVRVAMTVGAPREGVSAWRSLPLRARALQASKLVSNGGICYQGVVPAGDGFKMTLPEIVALGYRPHRLPRALRRYVIGRDLVQRPETRFIVDFFGHTASEAQAAHPALLQRLRDSVHPQRLHNKRAVYRERWWWFAEPRPAMRRALSGLPRFIVTPYTAKHRPFVFVAGDTLPDAMAYAIASDDAAVLGVLSSEPHRAWCLATGGTLADRPRYTSDVTFLRYPFPACSHAQQQRVRELGEQLDAHRKARLAVHPDLTLTGMYNVLSKVRADAALTDKDRDVYERGLVSLLREIHDGLDAVVIEAYGWPRELPAERMVAGLVALNAERHGEEKRGHFRWLRPDLQSPTGEKVRDLRPSTPSGRTT